jgi:hypothetical protein
MIQQKSVSLPGTLSLPLLTGVYRLLMVSQDIQSFHSSSHFNNQQKMYHGCLGVLLQNGKFFTL